MLSARHPVQGGAGGGKGVQETPANPEPPAAQGPHEAGAAGQQSRRRVGFRGVNGPVL